MIVDEYDAKFNKVACYVPKYFDDGYQHARKFERGLNDKIMYCSIALKLLTYAEVLDHARVIEQESIDFLEKMDEKKRTWEASIVKSGVQANGGNNKRRIGDNDQGRGGHNQYRSQNHYQEWDYNSNQFRNQNPNQYQYL